MWSYVVFLLGANIHLLLVILSRVALYFHPTLWGRNLLTFFLSFPGRGFLLRFLFLLPIYWRILDCHFPLFSFNFGALLPSSLADIWISEVEIAIELISARTASLVIFLIILIFRVIKPTPEVSLISVPKHVIFSLPLHQLFHTSATTCSEGHGLDGGFDDLIGPSWGLGGWIFFIMLRVLLL